MQVGTVDQPHALSLLVFCQPERAISSIPQSEAKGKRKYGTDRVFRRVVALPKGSRRVRLCKNRDLPRKADIFASAHPTPILYHTSAFLSSIIFAFWKNIFIFCEMPRKNMHNVLSPPSHERAVRVRAVIYTALRWLHAIRWLDHTHTLCDDSFRPLWGE